jgi:hypothetical protein
MALRPRVPAAILGLAALAAGCQASAPVVEPRITRVVPDAPELRAALVRAGWNAAAAHAPAPVVRFADVAPPHGDELVLAWEPPREGGGVQAAIAVHAIDARRHAVATLCFDAAGEGFLGGAGGALELADVTGDRVADLIVRRRAGDDVAVTIYALQGGRFGPLATARGHRVELRDLDGDGRVEVLVSGEIGEGLRGFPEVLRLEESGALAPFARRLSSVMQAEAKAYIDHARSATIDPALRAQAFRSASEYLASAGYAAEAAQLAREAEFVAPAGGVAGVERRD